MSTAGHLACALALALALAAGCGGPKLDAKCATNRLELAKEYLAKLDVDNAQREADRSVACNPTNEEAENLLGLIDFLRAVKNVQLLEVDDCIEGVDAEALALEKGEQLRAAEQHFTRATELAPNLAEAHSNLGLVALQLEDYERARLELERALASPDRLTNIGLTRAHLGWVYFRTGDYPRAAKELRQADQFNPGMCVANYRLGRVYFARRQWADAAERLQRVASTASCRMQEAHLYLMLAQAALGREDAAAAARRQCLELAPRSCIARQCSEGEIARAP
jgi:tetratricopeptide (TPR) repeat protein